MWKSGYSSGESSGWIWGVLILLVLLCALFFGGRAVYSAATQPTHRAMASMSHIAAQTENL